MAITNIPGIDESRVRIQPLPQATGSRVTLDMLRLDLIDEVISGNKWYKLKYNLAQAESLGCDTVLTFGGAWSNHLLATAEAARRKGLNSIGIVRGMHRAEDETVTLRDCRKAGMQLVFVSRQEYDRKEKPDFLQPLQHKFGPGVCIIPEGGSNEQGRHGAGEIALLVPERYSHICIPVGTGTTMAGLRSVLPAHQFLTGFAPMKGGRYLSAQMSSWLPEERNKNWALTDAWHFGGFGKTGRELLQFMDEFRKTYDMELDRVYTAKMMYGVTELIGNGHFPQGARILCIHTGGLQGNRSMDDKP